jgi:hypothetical protein
MEATMLKHESNDLDVPGYFLPEDSQFRLKKLRDHVTFLSRLAQPRTWDEQQESAPEVPVGELAICLELLAEQVALVLDEVSWPAQRQMATAESDVAPAASPRPYDAASERFSFGVTLDQIDTLNRLIQTISAQGDVVACSPAAGLDTNTLPRVGQAIYDGMEAVRAILHEVEAQQLGQARDPRNRVGEERAVYGAGFASLDLDGAPAMVLPAPAFTYAGQSRSMRLY